MDLGIEEQTVVITGGASGIGLATARLFLEEGAKVAIWDRVVTNPQANDVVAGAGASCMACVTDVTKQALLDNALEQTQQRLGPIDHVVHAAAIGSGKFGFPYSNLQPNDWSSVLEVNIMGMVRVVHCLAPVLQSRSGGTMTFLASIAGQVGSQSDPPYSASKAANINFAQCLAKDLAPHGVRVNIVNPGMVETELNKSVWSAWQATQPAHERRSYKSWAEEKIRNLVPLGRWQTSDDVASAIVFLASRRAANITGQCINVDGGFVMHS